MPATGSDDPSDDLDAKAARAYTLDVHAELLETALDCAGAVATGFEATIDGDPAIGDSRKARDELRVVLDRAGVLDGLAEALPGIVDAAGGSMRARPVAAPPYVAVTSAGPVARATLGDRRLVIRIDVYAPTEGAFVWHDPPPEGALSVQLRD